MSTVNYINHSHQVETKKTLSAQEALDKAAFMNALYERLGLSKRFEADSQCNVVEAGTTDAPPVVKDPFIDSHWDSQYERAIALRKALNDTIREAKAPDEFRKKVLAGLKCDS